VFEAAATAGGATPVASVEAEGAGAVAAFARQRRFGKQRAQRVESADVAGRVAARGLADRALVDKHRIREQLGAEQPLEGTRCLGGLAEVARQRRVQHVLHQRTLARAADPRDADQAVERQLQRHALQVVLARAFEQEFGRGRLDELAETRRHLLACAEIGSGERVGLARGFGRAVEDDAATAFAGAGAHVDQAVGGQHHRGVVFDHHQRVAGIAQPVHGLDDAVHVARVQADARFIEHEHRVDEAGA
jgi:hypothetical protein